MSKGGIAALCLNEKVMSFFFDQTGRFGGQRLG
jgi:hypothetical protein